MVDIKSDGTTEDNMALYDIDEVERLQTDLAAHKEALREAKKLIEACDPDDDKLLHLSLSYHKWTGHALLDGETDG